MEKKKGVVLYNVLFPFWMLCLFPVTWFVVLPGNFLIDSLVLLICMKKLQIEEKKQFYKKNIWKIFGFGLLADAIGSGFMFLMVVLEFACMGDEWYITIPALLISAALIFVFNYFVTFKKVEDKRIRFWIPMAFAIATAPYTFLVPSSWLYY